MEFVRTMGWFDEQIRLRKQRDDEVFSDAFLGIADAVMGTNSAQRDSRLITKNAIDEILKFYHVKSQELPDSVTDPGEQLEYLLRPWGIMRRTVRLEKGWYKDAIGAMLAVRKDDGRFTALIPGKFSGYSFLDGSGKRVRLTAANEGLFEPEAIAFYKPFPLRAIGIPDLLRYMLEALSTADFVLVGLAALALTLIGMLTPFLNNLIFSQVVDSGSVRLLLAAAVFLVCVKVSSLLLSSVRELLEGRIGTKLSLSVQAATMMRVLSLPADFFKRYSSGELSSRAQYIGTLCDMLVSTLLSTGLTSLFSLLYISQIFAYAPALVVPALCVIFATILFSLLTSLVQQRLSKAQMALGTQESGMSYALISGIQKLKLAGAEKRAFARWAGLYAQEARYAYDPAPLIKFNAVIGLAISLAGTLAMYCAAVRSHVSVSEYYAFNAAYGMVSGAFMSLTSLALTIARFKPVIEMAKPILDAVPEVSQGKQVVTRLSGALELNNVSFRYTENTPLVIDNLSLKIRPGQYIAIVGATGCGKSTLMRLLLGFETPQKGAIYYDGKDLSTIDLKSLRQKIGVVMQNGRLFSGDIYSNIVISAPELTMDEAWEAAELAGIADDIRRMPMGMHTLISEGSGGVSGGQRQRLMIARAIAPKPKLLMFDEATSALDNITQKRVSQSLDGLNCTRIIIAHRLSTIRQCDRILVLDRGKIVEDGAYDELLALNGRFAELVERQRLDAAPAK